MTVCLALSAMLLVAVLSIAACGGKGSPSNGNTSVASDPPASTTPDWGGKFVGRGTNNGMNFIIVSAQDESSFAFEIMGEGDSALMWGTADFDTDPLDPFVARSSEGETLVFRLEKDSNSLLLEAEDNSIAGLYAIGNPQDRYDLEAKPDQTEQPDQPDQPED